MFDRVKLREVCCCAFIMMDVKMVLPLAVGLVGLFRPLLVAINEEATADSSVSFMLVMVKMVMVKMVMKLLMMMVIMMVIILVILVVMMMMMMMTIMVVLFVGI